MKRNETFPGGSVLGLCFDACMMISLMIAERTKEGASHVLPLTLTLMTTLAQYSRRPELR